MCWCSSCIIFLLGAINLSIHKLLLRSCVPSTNPEGHLGLHSGQLERSSSLLKWCLAEKLPYSDLGAYFLSILWFHCFLGPYSHLHAVNIGGKVESGRYFGRLLWARCAGGSISLAALYRSDFIMVSSVYTGVCLYWNMSSSCVPPKRENEHSSKFCYRREAFLLAKC